MDRRVEESLYEQVAREISSGDINQGLWLKATIDSNGEDFKAKSLYAKYRLKQLFEDIQYEKAALRKIESQNRKELKKKGMALCPNCHLEVKPIRKPRGNFWFGLYLCFYLVIPGVIYFLLKCGYKNICPNCYKVIFLERVYG